MATIRPDNLEPAGAVNPGAAIIVDQGATVNKATPLQVVDAAIPLASQSEAEAGEDNAKRVTPLRVRQAIDALGVSAEELASSAPDKGAALVGLEDGGSEASFSTVQGFVDYASTRLDYIDFSVTDEGARPDAPDNLAAINAAFAKAAAAGGRGRVIFPAVSGDYTEGVLPEHGFRVSDQVVIPARVSVVMRSPIIYEGPADKIAMVYGDEMPGSSYEITEYHNIDVWILNNRVAPWEVSGSVGAILYAHKYCSINIISAQLFDTGVILSASNTAFCYNNIHVGELRGCRVGMKWEAINGGWINDNLFLGGRVSAHPTPTGHTATSRYGLITETDLHRVHNNVWIKGCFELGADADTVESIPIVLNDAYQNTFTQVRGEAHKGWIARIAGDSENNIIESSYGRLSSSIPSVNNGNDILFVDDQTTYQQNIFFMIGERMQRSITRVSIPDFASRFYASGASGGVAGLGLRAADPGFPGANNANRTDPACTLNAEGGVVLSNAARRLSLKVDLGGARVIDVKLNSRAAAPDPMVICYDSAGDRLFDAGVQYAKALNVNGSGGFATNQYGGAYSISGMQHNLVTIGLLPEVASVEILLGGGSGFTVYGVEVSTPQLKTLSLAPQFPHKVASAKPTVTANVPEGCMVVNAAFSGVGVYGWLLAGGAWRDMGAGPGDA